MTKKLTRGDLTDEEIEQVLNSRGFRKMLGYKRLSDGIEVLKDEDEIFGSLVETIRKNHSSVNSEDSVREFFEMFIAEVETFTEPLVDEETGESVDIGQYSGDTEAYSSGK